MNSILDFRSFAIRFALRSAALAALVALGSVAGAGGASAACGLVAHTTGVHPASVNTGVKSGVHSSGGGSSSSACGSAGASAAATVHSAPGGGIAAIHALASPHRGKATTAGVAGGTKTASGMASSHTHAAHAGPAGKGKPKT